MTTTTTTTAKGPVATATPIVALDLGKYKGVACGYDPAGPQARFQTLEATRANLRALLERCRPGVVVLEACLLAGWVRDLCAELGLACRAANTAGEAWKFKYRKRKTDRDDALRLAQLQALGELPVVTPPPNAVRQRRCLIAYRQALVGRRVATQNRIRALFAAQGLAVPRGHRAWTATGLEGIERHARALADRAPAELWRGQLELELAALRHTQGQLAQVERRLDGLAQADPDTQLLQTAPGAGPRTAEAVASYLHEPQRFTRGEQVSAYGGLVPRQHQSGEADRKGRISRRGPAPWRKLLVECAWAMLRHSPWARAVYRRLTGGGRARQKRAIVALARKLLVRCWAMLRDGAPWRTEPAPPAGPA
jgi:transposase